MASAIEIKNGIIEPVTDKHGFYDMVKYSIAIEKLLMAATANEIKFMWNNYIVTLPLNILTISKVKYVYKGKVKWTGSIKFKLVSLEFVEFMMNDDIRHDFMLPKEVIFELIK